MNKTVNINVAGFAFIIEEVAFDALSNYLNKLGNSISDEAEKKEVIEDIEARIAELFQEYLTKEHREVIHSKDVQQVIEVLGEPEEIYDDSESFTSATEEKSKPKRLYRDVENGMMGGVCSGLAAYFKTDAIWPRIIFLFLFLSFGSGFLLYIVLWIIVPPATTTSQKLEMQGEPVNIDSIKRSFKETKEQIEKEIKFQKNKYKKDKVKNKSKTVAEEFLTAGGSFFSKLFKVIGVFIGIILWIVAFSLLLSSFAVFFGDPVIHIFGNGSIVNSFSFEDFRGVFMNSKFFDWGISSILFSITMAFFIGGFHLLFGAKRKSMVSWTVPSFFFMGLLLIGIGYFNQTKAYLVTESNEKRIPLDTENDTLYITSLHLKASPELNTFIWKISNSVFSMNERFAIADEKIYFSNCTFSIRPSVNESFNLMVTSSASGKSEEDANIRAENIQFSFKSLGDSLILNSYFTTPIENGIKNQKLKYTLEIPHNKYIYIDSSLLEIALPIFNKQNLENKQLIGSIRQFKNGILE